MQLKSIANKPFLISTGHKEHYSFGSAGLISSIKGLGFGALDYKFKTIIGIEMNIIKTAYERPEAELLIVRMESAMLTVSNPELTEDNSDEGFFDD